MHPTHLPAAVALLIFAAAAASGQTFANPVVDDGADPWVLPWKGAYFYTRTTGTDVRVGRSARLTGLGENDVSVWRPPEGTPYSKQLWAPELHRLNGKWYVYVAADGGKDADHRMYVLEGNSDDPQGSYTFKGQLSVPADRWAIDGTVLEHGGNGYFVWSGRTFDDERDQSQSIYIARMSDPLTLDGPRVKISSPDLPWERHGHPVNEGPQVLKSPNGRVFVTYSASGYYTPQYALGLLELVGKDPLDPKAWRKGGRPIFAGANGVEGTGHASFAPSPDGREAWVVYHARRAPDARRDVRLGRFVFANDGTPRFAPPTATGAEAAAPSGLPLVTFVANGCFDRGREGRLLDFETTGDSGSLANDGGAFPVLTGGDGPDVGFLGVGGEEAGLSQVVGPLHKGTWTFTAKLALGNDAAAAAKATPATIVLRLDAVAADGNSRVLGQARVKTADVAADQFKPFSVTAAATDRALAGSMLRLVVLVPADPATAGAAWRLKVDALTLDFEPADR